MRILITGADGQLGQELQRVLAKHELVLGLHPEFDLLNPEVGKPIRAARPDVVIHGAAYTDVDRAEQEPELAMAVNARGTEYVARAAAEVGARLIIFSTDYVFDGRKRTPYFETDRPNPINAYGKSKLEGERHALSCCPNTLVVRTSWLYGPKGNNFVKTIMRLAAEGAELRVVSDQRGCPTYACELAIALSKLIELDTSNLEPRTLHLTGSGDCTWYEFACAIVAEMGLSCSVLPITTSEAGRRTPRPPYSVLGNRVLARVGITLPSWRESLKRFVKQVKVQVEAE